MAEGPEQVAESHPPTIHCDRHGVTAYCLICRHLRDGAGLGYWAIEPEPEIGEPAQAWCEGCDAVLDAEQGWTDRADAAADWKLYCAGCYADTLARHEQRGWCAGGPSPE